MFSHLNCTKCELCASADTIFDNTSLVHVFLLIQLFISPLTILATAMMLFSIILMRKVHLNQRILLLAFTTAVLMANIGAFLSCIYQLYTGFVIEEDERCDWQIFKAESCLGLKYVYVIGMVGTSLGPIFLVIERIAGCVRLQKYKRNYPLLVLILLIYILLSIGWLILDLTSSEQVFPYAAVELYSGQLAIDAVEFLFGTNALAVFFSLFLWVFNNSRMINTPSPSLNDARKDTKIMLPISILSFSLVLSSLLILKNHLPIYDEDTFIDKKVLDEVQGYATWAELQVTLLPIATFLICLSLYTFSTQIREAFQRVTGLSLCLGKRDPASTNPSTLSFSFDSLSNSSKFHINTITSIQSNVSC